MGTFPPINKTLEGLIEDTRERLTLVERRLTIPGRIGPYGQQVTDWNDAIGAGFYWGNAALNQPVPISQAVDYWVGITQVFARTSGDEIEYLQTLKRPDVQGGPTYERTFNSGTGVWSVWASQESGIGSTANLGTIDLDTVIQPGTWYQPTFTQATPARHYPIDAAGTLIVEVTGNNREFVTQTYVQRADAGSQPRIWNRGKFAASVWQPWALVNGPISFHAYRTSAVSIPNTTWTTLTWNATARNVGGITYSSGVFTVPVDGLYLVHGVVRYTSMNPASGQRTSRLTVTGLSAGGYEGNAFAPINSVTSGAEVARTIAMQAGDTVSFDVYQAQGAAMNTVSGEQYTRIQVDRIGPI